LQSENAKELKNRFKIDISNPDSLFLIIREKVYIKSTAALMVCKELNGMIKILFPLIIFPVFFRDFVYDLIAKNRYKIFGRKESCRILTEGEREKFLK